MDAALAGVDSPDPSPAVRPPVPRPAILMERPPPGTPQPGSPREEARGTTASSATQPTTPPGPKLQPRTEPMSRTRPRHFATRWSTRSGWRIIRTDAAPRQHGSFAPNPYAGGAASPGTLAATAGPPWCSSNITSKFNNHGCISSINTTKELE
jgi:hypothetical protein